MKITIDSRVRASLTDDEYKYLLLLEFHEKFWERVVIIRKKISSNFVLHDDGVIGYKEHPNLKLLKEETEKLINDLDIPVLLYGAIESLIQWNTIIYTVKPVLVFGIQHQLNRRALYNDQLLPLAVTRSDNTNTGKLIKKSWYESNKRVLENSIAPAYPLIQIQKKVKTKTELLQAIGNEWENIKAAMDDYEKSLPFPIEISHIPTRDIERNALIYRYRKSGMEHKEVYDAIEREHGIHFALRDREVGRICSEFEKLLKDIGFIKM